MPTNPVSAKHTKLLAGVAGLESGALTVSALVVDKVSYTLPELSAKLTGLAAPYDAVAEAHVVYEAKLQARIAAEPETAKFLAAFQHSIQSALGTDNPELAKFGIKPRKPPRKLTAAENEARAAKARATRLKLHTLGKAQKRALLAESAPSVAPATPPAASPPGETAGGPTPAK
jgi:hypothetical protein